MDFLAERSPDGPLAPGESREYRVTLRIVGTVTLTETGDSRGLVAKYEVEPEALVEPEAPRAAAEHLALSVCKKALDAMCEDPQYALSSATAPSRAVRERFGGGRPGSK